MIKRVMFVMCAALQLAVSCSKSQDDAPDAGFILKAGVEEVSTKTVLGDKKSNGKYPIFWSDGDIISVNGIVSKPLSGAGGGSTATFSFASTPASASVYKVLYPGSAYSDKLSLDGVRIPLYGNSYDLSEGVSMRTAASVVRFVYNGTATLTRLVVTSMQDEKISGLFAVGKDGSGALNGELTPEDGAVSSFTVTYSGGLGLASEGKTVYFVIPPGTYAKGLRAVAHDSDGGSMTLRFFKSGATLSAGRTASFPAIDYVAGSDVVMTGGEGFEPIDADLQGDAGTDDMDSAAGEVQVSLKVGTYNIWAPSARKSVMDADETVSEQRSWANSYEAVADMINWLDCDVIGIQEVTNMVFNTYITGPSKDYDGNYHTLNSKVPGYSWVIYNAANTNYDSLFPKNTTNGGLGSTDAILYKSSVLTLEGQGRCWLNGSRKVAPQDSDWDRIGTNRPATWAKFTHKASGKQFIFITTHLDLPNAGNEDDPAMPQRRNATELIEWFAPTYAAGLPSIITGDMNVDNGDSAGNYDILVSGRWKDVYDTMREEGSLSYTEQRSKGTMNANKNENGGVGSWRPDHILCYGFTPSYYKVGREKFATKDGTMHWPSDHLPVKVILNF